MTGDADESVLAALRREGLGTVDGAFAYEEGEDLAKPGLGRRRRTRLAIAGDGGATHVLYLKRYGPQSVASALKRWWTLGRRRSAARAEFENVQAARAAGVPTMQALACGEDACPLGAGRSYLIVTAVPGDAMERCFHAFLERHAADGQAARVTSKLAGLVARLHAAGYVHRDLYASHVFLDESSDEAELYLIDLARMFAPRWRKRRWVVKDLAQLKYSMPPAWVDAHWGAFLAEYLGGAASGEADRLARAVDRKVRAIRRRAERKAAGAAEGERR